MVGNLNSRRRGTPYIEGVGEQGVEEGIFGSKRKEVTEGSRKSYNRSFAICTLHQISLGLSN
jgi:hypothetical protein